MAFTEACDADFTQETLKEHRILVCVLIFYSKTKSSVLISVSLKIIIHLLLKKRMRHIKLLMAFPTSKVSSGTTIVIQLTAMVMCVLLCSAITSMERRKSTDHTM